MAKFTINLPDVSKLVPLILFLSLITNLIFVIILVPSLLSQFRSTSNKSTTSTATTSKDNIFDQINPTSGFEINATYGDLGPKMVALGVIDQKKFESTYQNSNQPLTADQEKILTQGSDQKIKITSDNSYFLLNFFWAVGLANKSNILSQGDMVKYGGQGGAGNFASTGGWTLAKSSAMNYYSKSPLISLTPDQEKLVENVSSNIYRPCCDNPTSFPDCNHGMALLGILELMASQGASEADMYNAAKYINAFWFPGNYSDLALYFKNKEGKSFKDIDAKTILSKDYSSATGYQNKKQWLTQNGVVETPAKQGGGCGV